MIPDPQISEDFSSDGDDDEPLRLVIIVIIIIIVQMKETHVNDVRQEMLTTGPRVYTNKPPVNVNANSNRGNCSESVGTSQAH